MLHVLQRSLPMLSGLLWPLIGLLVWHAVVCVRLSRRARRGTAIPPHLWSGLLMAEPEWAEFEMALEQRTPDLSLRVVVCPPTSPPLMPGWLESIYPTRPMHCAAMSLPADVRESSGDLTVQEVIDSRYGL